MTTGANRCEKVLRAEGETWSCHRATGHEGVHRAARDELPEEPGLLWWLCAWREDGTVESITAHTFATPNAEVRASQMAGMIEHGYPGGWAGSIGPAAAEAAPVRGEENDGAL